MLMPNMAGGWLQGGVWNSEPAPHAALLIQPSGRLLLLSSLALWEDLADVTMGCSDKWWASLLELPSFGFN